MEKIKETIKYYIVLLYYNTIYKHYMHNVELLIEGISRCRTRESAVAHSSIPLYKHISKSYKKKLIDEKFGRMS